VKQQTTTEHNDAQEPLSVIKGSSPSFYFSFL